MSRSRTAVVLLRHGPTAWSEEGRFAGTTDLPLTPAGREATPGVRSRLPETARVVTSTLVRARETAALLGFPAAEADPRLRERDYGDFEGLTTAEIRAASPEWDVWADDVPGGEPLADLVARVDEVVAEARESDEVLLLVSHAHWIRMFAARWLGLPPDRAALFRLDTLGIARLGWEREHPVMLGWG